MGNYLIIAARQPSEVMVVVLSNLPLLETSYVCFIAKPILGFLALIVFPLAVVVMLHYALSQLANQ